MKKKRGIGRRREGDEPLTEESNWNNEDGSDELSQSDDDEDAGSFVYRLLDERVHDSKGRVHSQHRQDGPPPIRPHIKHHCYRSPLAKP